ncbi:HAD family hydrolase [Adhaeribacter aquaticus]|uniref:HAD family hydrolase n=1 Tax=Adhaeribacter aquaticus TaxID=299567 RepID=UPI00041BEBDE|nr:HAD family hydrolase [Adhaeribacter aquaticus]
MKTKTIAFDADDTLWINETIFTSTRAKFKAMIAKYVSDEFLDDKLYQTEKRNLCIFGYGIKGFTLSMIETALEITKEQISGRDIHQIMAFAKDMLVHPVELMAEVENTLKALKENYRLMVITKGDLFDQETKIARSGLADYFDLIEIVSEKDERTYRHILHKHNISAENFIMIGNSVKSDILPVCALGGKAIHVPFHETWTHEIVPEEQAAAYFYDTITSLAELPDLIKNTWS